MFAGQAAADLAAEFQDVGAEGLAQLQIAGLVGVEEDQRVHVAIPGMEDVGDVEAVVLRHFADPLQHIGQFGNRDRAVETHIVVDLPHRAKGRLAPGPDTGAFIR